jgi:hypothetical protein
MRGNTLCSGGPNRNLGVFMKFTFELPFSYIISFRFGLDFTYGAGIYIND